MPLDWRSEPLQLPRDCTTVLPFGNGRSYGDSCLNPDGNVLATRGLNRFMDFRAGQGILRCETGATLSEVLDLILPHGWFLPVVPGTQYVTVGGAIANDVHGKNHHVRGTFGQHVLRFELVRSDGNRFICSNEHNQNWFRATVGGLGLTGLITWAELQLRPIKSAMVEAEIKPFASLNEFIELSRSADKDAEYTVGWFDAYSYRNGKLKGIFSTGRHVSEDDGSLDHPRPTPRLAVPISAPSWVLNKWAIRGFNNLYYAMLQRAGLRVSRFEKFLFPLDGIKHWNRLYGRRGFMQFQCVLPEHSAERGISELLAKISSSGQGSFLSTLKVFGQRPSPGLLSFPVAGMTLALDFQNRGEPTLKLLAEYNELTLKHGGRIYPAKDACMSAATFAAGYPSWKDLLPFIDPRFSSCFWRRTAQALTSKSNNEPCHA